MKFYVPAVLVIEAESEESAQVEADRILSTITSLGVEDLEGFVWVEHLEPSPAPPDWLFVDTYLHNDCGVVTVGNDYEESE